MRRFYLLGFGLWLCVWLASSGRAESTFQLLDGKTVSGEIVLPSTPEMLTIRVGPNKYEKVGWTNFTQATLQELVKNPKLAQHVEPYIEVTIEDRIKKTEPPKIIEPVKLERPPKGSLIGGLFGSSVGLVALLLIYAANIYAGYEISVIRAYPAAMVCGVSAIAPVIGPIIFLCMPTKMKSLHAGEEEILEELPPPAPGAAIVDNPLADASGEAHAPGGLSIAHAAAPAAAAHPEAQVFKRGQFTFNRRFIETKFASFFGVTRRDAEKDLIMLIKSARGEFPASRISRIAANDMHVEVRKGGASAEVQIPFVEIQEIHLKHKDA